MRVRRIPLWILMPVGGAFLLLALSFGALYLMSGDARVGWAYLRGDALIVSPASIDLGRIPPAERQDFEISVKNIASRPIKIVGASSTCTCLAIDGLPKTIAAGQSVTLKARVVAPRDKPEFAQVLTYYTDSPESPKLAVRVRAVVSAPST